MDEKLAKANEDGFKAYPLRPHERQPWNFKSVAKNTAAGTDELVHLRIVGQEVKCGDRMIPKKYKWSCPFQVETLQTFTIKVEPEVDSEHMLAINNLCKTDAERSNAVKEMSNPVYIRIVCKTGVVGDGTATLGSIFIIISEEPEDLASYRLRNESAHIGLCYKQ